MSLIHEALQKAEAERRAGELPPLLSVSMPQRLKPRDRSGPPLWIGLGVAVLAAAGYVNRDLWWSEQTLPAARDDLRDAPAPTQAPTLRPTRSPAATATPARKPQELRPATPPPVDAFSAARADLIASRLGLPSATPSVDLPAESPAAQRPREQLPGPQVPALPVPAAVPAPPAPLTEKPVAGREHPPQPNGEQGAVEASASSQEAAHDSQQPAASPLPLVFELPLSMRKALPALKVTMLVYSDDPARRFAIIDGKRVNQNGVMGNDLSLIEIQRDAMVLDFRGKRFLLPRIGR